MLRGLLVLSIAIVGLGMSGCLPQIPVVQKDQNKTVLKDLQGNEIKTSEDGKNLDISVKGEDGNDMKIRSSQDKPFSTCGLPDPPKMKASEKSSVTEMEAGGKTVVQAYALSDATVKEIGEFYAPKFSQTDSKVETPEGVTLMGTVDGMKVLLTASKTPEGTQVYVQAQK